MPSYRKKSPPSFKSRARKTVKASIRHYVLLVGLLVLYIWIYHRPGASLSEIENKPNVQHHPQKDVGAGSAASKRLTNQERADGVKEAFLHGWKGYRQFAYTHNELMPLSRRPSDARSVMAATAVDSLTTGILMELPDIAEDVLDFIDLVDFSDTNGQVSMFSSTKTFIGGMLSAYDLLTGPKAHLLHDRSKIARLVEQASSLAESLAFAFDTESGLPQNYLFLRPWPKHRNISVTDITAAGTLSLEWTHLADLTKTQRYAHLVANAEDAIFNAFDVKNDKCKQSFEGLFGKVMDLQTGKFETFNGGFMSGSGSFYEYLLKMYVYSPDEYKQYRNRWIRAADAAILHLSSHPSTRQDLTFLAAYDCTELRYITDHTAFFAAGNFILGGSVLSEPKYTKFGLKLVESQVAKHRATVTGLAPDKWTWLPEHCKNKANKNAKECQLIPECAHQTEFYAQNGHCILDPVSKIRPETLESLYYAYRVTRDSKYQDMSWEIFKAINRTARIPSGGFSGIADVNVMPEENGAAGRIDSMYTWIMGETLKYAWMIHAEDDAEWQVNQDGKNKWVFNTQAHPLRIRR